MHVIPNEKAIDTENQSIDIEHISYWLISTTASTPQRLVLAGMPEIFRARAVRMTQRTGALRLATWPTTAVWIIRRAGTCPGEEAGDI